MSLEMRPACERCSDAITHDGAAFMCSYECTFCMPCSDEMEFVCPNCCGELVARPRRRGGVERVAP